MRFVECLDWAKEERAGGVWSLAGVEGDYALVQLLVPDAAGHDPDDPECDPAYAGVERFDQPMAVLGKMH